MLYLGGGAALAAREEAARLLGEEVLPASHPDLLSLTAERGSIGIGQIREALSWGRYAPIRAPWKVILVGPAERLSHEAASALLKSLEDTPEYLAYILYATDPDVVLPTIRSRCRKVWVPDPRAYWEERLAEAGYGPEERAFLLGFLELDPGALAGFVAERRAPLREQEEAREELRELPPEELIARFLAYHKDPIRRRVAARLFLDALPGAEVNDLLHAAERLARGGREPVLAFLAEYLVFVYSEAPDGWGGLSPGERIQLLRKLSLAKEEVEANANLRLLLEVLFLWPRLKS
ncbi:hypothetical protein ACVNPS_05195 [Candidatus Bipolaricaulota sp. J31]